MHYLLGLVFFTRHKSQLIHPSCTRQQPSRHLLSHLPAEGHVAFLLVTSWAIDGLAL